MSDRRIAFPLLLVAALIAAIALIALHDHVSYYRVTSGSMLPTLPVGRRVAVQSDVSPAAGEIVVFRAPAGAAPVKPVCGVSGQGLGSEQPCGVDAPGSPGEVLVKRIVAGPGDLVALVDGHAVVNGVALSEPTIAACGGDPDCSYPVAVRVPAGQYFVLGDNRGASDDSRFWGPVPAASILGVVVRCGPLQTACQPMH